MSIPWLFYFLDAVLISQIVSVLSVPMLTENYSQLVIHEELAATPRRRGITVASRL